MTTSNRSHSDVQKVLHRVVSAGRAPGIVAEIYCDEPTWFGSAGVADTATGRERHRHERFRIGSATKAFTATVVLALVAEGRLSLDDTLDAWLPHLFEDTTYDPGAITVRHLLNQTSGIFSYAAASEFAWQADPDVWHERRFDTYSPEQLVRIGLANPPTNEPGASFRYSNTNYFLAALIVERVTGRTFAEELDRRVLRPLRLTGTSLPGTDAGIHGPHPVHYSVLFSTDPQPPVYDTTDMNQSFAWAAGGMISTTTDLNRFFTALLSGDLLPAPQLEEMLTTVSTEGSGWIPSTRYGLGVFEQTLPCGVTLWGNGGATYGSWCYALGARDGSHRVAIHANCDWITLDAFDDVLSAEFCPPAGQLG